MTRGRGGQDRSASSAAVAEAPLSDISEDGKRIVLAMREDFERMKKEFIEQLQEKTERIETLTSEVAQLKEKVNSLEAKVDDAEAYERRDTLVFSGEGIPPVEPGENST